MDTSADLWIRILAGIGIIVLLGILIYDNHQRKKELRWLEQRKHEEEDDEN